jgi:hypothetical protein
MTFYFSLRLAGLAVFLPLVAAGAWAQETDPSMIPSAERAQGVEDPSVRNPPLKPYRQMLKGLDAFDEQHQLAPQAQLRFILVPEVERVAFGTITLTISGPATAIAVPVARDGGFTLPRDAAAASDNADLVLNRKKDVLRWHADIRTPGVPDNARRLGDLRLECAVGWAATKDDAPFFLRGTVGLLGGPCHSPRAHPNYQPPRPVVAVTLVSGGRQAALPLHMGTFSPPYFDTSWNDDTLVVYQFKPAESKPAQAAPAAFSN